MSKHEVNNQGRIIHDPISSQIGESLSGNDALKSCASCGQASERKFCSINCYRTWQRSRPIVSRFWEKVRKGESSNSCWLWTASGLGGGKNQFYGQFTITRDGKQYHTYAHRVSWELHNGPIPDGLSVLHKCDTPRCVNPAHLFLGTHTDNMRDAAAKHRLSVPRRRRQIVSTEQLPEVERLIAAGELTYEQIGNRFGVTKMWVSQYVNRTRRLLDRPDAHSKTEVA
jgi:hypothetical protein